MLETNRRMRAAFEAASNQLGLPLVGPFKLKGETRGRPVAYAWSVDDVGSGCWCRVGYAQGPLGAKLLIRRRNPWLPRWRSSSVTTGDEIFDGLMFVRTSKPELLTVVLNHQTRRRLLDLSYDRKLKINDKSIGLSWRTPPQTSSEITETISSLIEVATALEGTGDSLSPNTGTSHQEETKTEADPARGHSRKKKPPPKPPA